MHALALVSKLASSSMSPQMHACGMSVAALPETRLSIHLQQTMVSMRVAGN